MIEGSNNQIRARRTDRYGAQTSDDTNKMTPKNQSKDIKKTNVNKSNDTNSKSAAGTVSLNGNFHEKTTEARAKR